MDVFRRWEDFYNKERIHSGIGFTSPVKHLEKQNIQIPKKINQNNDQKAA